MKYEFIDKAVWLEKEGILVISDLHIGYEEGLRERGVFLPDIQFKEIIDNLEKIFDILKKKKKKVKEIIILGDLKHEFGKINFQEWQEVLEFIDFLQGKTQKIILIKGNHDTILQPLVNKRKLDIK